MPSVFITLLAPYCALLAAGCDRSPPEIVLSGPTMGTTYTVKVASPPGTVDPSMVRVAIDDVLEHVDRSMSVYLVDSEVARFNASTSTDWCDVSADLAAVVQTSLDISTASDGVFDITVAPLVAAWGFGPAGEPKV